MKAVIVTKTCPICGTVVTGVKSKVGTTKTCGSAECKRAIKSGERASFYGRSHTAESRRKNSEAHRGKVTYRPPKGERSAVECGCGCGAMIDVPSWRIKKGQTNHFVDSEHFRYWQQNHHHPNYRGGSHPYGSNWPKIAAAIRERDKVCQTCGKTAEENGRALDVHHKTPWRETHDNDPANLIALCMNCHRAETHLENVGTAFFVVRPSSCVVCGEAFLPDKRGMKICSPACDRLRQHEYERAYRESAKEKHPDAYARKRARITKWQQENKERVNDSHRRSKESARMKAADLVASPDS